MDFRTEEVEDEDSERLRLRDGERLCEDCSVFSRDVEEFALPDFL